MDFNLGSALTEVVGLEKSLEMNAFLLLFNSARSTNMQLSKYYGQKELDKSDSLVSITKNLESQYKEYLKQKVVIRKDFFDNIINADNSYLISSFKLFEKFCEQLKIKLPKNIRIKYYIQFRESLKQEFQNNKDRYQELLDFFKNPIVLQNDNIIHLLDRYDDLKKFFTNPLQQNSEKKETLKDLYIEPLFSIHKNNLEELSENDKNQNFYLYSKTISINSFFNDYFLIGKKHEAVSENYDMVFVLGQPGQGKTSFCYKLIYDYIQSNNDIPKVPIIFQKIRDLVANDFINTPFDTIHKYNPKINFDEDEFILVLDGLDEAYMSGGITDNDLRNLYDRLKKRSNRKIKIILTSRFNFVSINDSCLDNTLVLQLNELSDEQIKLYCEKFKKFYPTNSLVGDILKILK